MKKGPPPMHALNLTWLMLQVCAARVRDAAARSRNDAGASTLELVILILGLITVSTLLVGVLVAAVKSRADQIQ